jgi:hypothetical protein
MAANPPLRSQNVISSRLANETLQVPASWRAKQFIGIGLVALLAIWYALMAGIRRAANRVAPTTVRF